MKISKGTKIGIVIVIIVVIIIGAIGSTYNTMTRQQEAVKSQWAQVQNQYQRRSDLIPNLVATVKGYATHEEKTLTEVTEARNNAARINLNANQLTPENLKKYQDAQGQISAALSRLLMVKESYPDLKANQNFINLQDELSGTENRISVERNRFNDMTKGYNAYIKTFPHNIFASMFNFHERAYFEAVATAQEAPKVQF